MSASEGKADIPSYRSTMSANDPERTFAPFQLLLAILTQARKTCNNLIRAHMCVTGTQNLNADGADSCTAPSLKNQNGEHLFDGCVVQRLPARDLAKKALP